MRHISVTFCVSNLERSSEVRLVQFVNMQDISVTFCVFRFSIPSIASNSSQWKNQNLQVVGRALAKEASNTTFLILNCPQLGPSSPSFRANAPSGLLVSCLNVSVFVASSNTAYDSWANVWLNHTGRHIKTVSNRRTVGDSFVFISVLC